MIAKRWIIFKRLQVDSPFCCFSFAARQGKTSDVGHGSSLAGRCDSDTVLIIVAFSKLYDHITVPDLINGVLSLLVTPEVPRTSGVSGSVSAMKVVYTLITT